MKTVKIGMLGCGTVGGGVLRLLRDNRDFFRATLDADLEVTRVLVRDLEKERALELKPESLTTDPERVLGDGALDVIVEVMGGLEPTKSLVERAIASGRPVVTANKMLLALHGPALVQKAISAGVDLAFEGSVGGGIPIIRVLRQALASDRVASLSGIVNGTCNFMLTRMRQDGISFQEALVDAQKRGYAEADPTLDIDGHDAAHKLVVLSMLAFGARVEHDQVSTEGIRSIDTIDHQFAERFGYVIKHLAIGRDDGQSIELRVHPALVRKDAQLANVSGVLNAVALEGKALGPCLLSGRGAGDLPTAVSVVADLLDVARARINGASGLATRGIKLESRPLLPMDAIEAHYYLRFEVFDRPGVLARITGALGDENVSIEQMVQLGRGDSTGAPVQVVILTHTAREKGVQAALAKVLQMDFVAKPTHLIRVHGE